MANNVTEHVVDTLKFTVVGAPPISVGLFGVALEDWMMIASIVASLFILLDKVPSVWERVSGWINKKRNRSSSSSPPDNPSS